METFEYAIFFSTSKFTWPLSISWIILACHYGYGGFINTILSCKSYVPLNRLSYCAYLIHPVIMVAYLYSQEALFHGTLVSLVRATSLFCIYLLFFSWTYFFFSFIGLFIDSLHFCHIRAGLSVLAVVRIAFCGNRKGHLQSESSTLN